MKANKHIWAATGFAATLVLGATWSHTARAEDHNTFHVVGHLKLPATKIRNDYHHLHISESNGRRLLSVSNSNNVLTIVDVSNRGEPTLFRQMPLPATVTHGDPVTLIGGVVLVTEETGKPEIPGVRTVSFVSLSPQTACKVTARYENVTGLEEDATHVYLISGNDLWILGGREQFSSFSTK
jgi:hypothetical protein